MKKRFAALGALVISLAAWTLPAAFEQVRKDVAADEAKKNLANLFTSMKGEFGEY